MSLQKKLNFLKIMKISYKMKLEIWKKKTNNWKHNCLTTGKVSKN